MTMASQRSVYLDRPPPSSMADVIDLILDKGLVIDAYARVSLVGVELVTVDARIVVAGVDTYLRFAEAVNRLDLTLTAGSGGLRQHPGNDGNEQAEERPRRRVGTTSSRKERER